MTDNMHGGFCGTVNVTDRKCIDLTGILSVDSFDESLITLSVPCGTLTVEGEGLHITVLDLDKGKVSATGTIGAVYYSDSDAPKKGGLFSRVFGSRE